MRQGLIDAVKKTQEEELTAANENFRQFASTHEGYAVILEEAQETEAELQQVGRNLNALWDLTKRNAENDQIAMIAEGVEAAAQNMAAEAIQTAAMARKLINYLEAQPEKEKE